MPTAPKPLFRLDALRPKLAAFALPLAATGARPKFGNWKSLLHSKAADASRDDVVVIVPGATTAK